MKEISKCPIGEALLQAVPTFDDVFLRVEGDNGQVAGKAGKAGWKFNLSLDVIDRHWI